MGNRTSAFTWKIENFSTIQNQKLYSDSFYVGGNKWQLFVYPTGSKVDDQLSVYLEVADSETLPHGWSRCAQFRFTVVNQLSCETSITRVAKHEFNASARGWGYPSFMPLSNLKDPKKGYLMNDACLLTVEISTDHKNNPLESYKLIPTVELKSKGQVNSPIPIQQSSAPKLPTIQSKEADQIQAPSTEEEDMDTFFTSLESELETLNVIPSHEEAKEALAKIEEALNMPPSSFHDSQKFSPIRKAFKVLSSSSALTTEQNTELLAMEANFKQLPERVVKAVHDKNLLTEKESLKLTLSRNLEHSLSKFKEAKEEVKQAEEKIVEAQKHKQNMLAEQKEMFKVSKKLKAELEALGKEWAEYEAKAKVAEEEQKTIVAEWGRLKECIASIKGIMEQIN